MINLYLAIKGCEKENRHISSIDIIARGTVITRTIFTDFIAIVTVDTNITTTKKKSDKQKPHTNT